MTARIMVAPHSYGSSSSYNDVFSQIDMFQPPYAVGGFAYGNEWNQYAIMDFNALYNPSYFPNSETKYCYPRKRKRAFTIEALLGLNGDDDDDDDDDDEPKNKDSRLDQSLWSQRLMPEPVVFLPSAGNSDEIANHRLETASPDSSNEPSRVAFSPLSPGAQSLSSSCSSTEKSPSARKTKRLRTIFTPTQLHRLESEFERSHYLVGSARLELASELTLTDSQVKIWFQNRRIKQRKQYREEHRAKAAKITGDCASETSEQDTTSETYSSCTSGDDEFSN